MEIGLGVVCTDHIEDRVKLRFKTIITVSKWEQKIIRRKINLQTKFDQIVNKVDLSYYITLTLPQFRQW